MVYVLVNNFSVMSGQRHRCLRGSALLDQISNWLNHKFVDHSEDIYVDLMTWNVTLC